MRVRKEGWSFFFSHCTEMMVYVKAWADGLNVYDAFDGFMRWLQFPERAAGGSRAKHSVSGFG